MGINLKSQFKQIFIDKKIFNLWPVSIFLLAFPYGRSHTHKIKKQNIGEHTLLISDLSLISKTKTAPCNFLYIYLKQ